MVSPSAAVWDRLVMLVVLVVCELEVSESGRPRVASRPFKQVRTTQGVARGYFSPRPPHYAYLGLPYARAPTPEQRFKAPEPPPSWDGIFEATHRVKCPQDGSGDENCLVVNVFTPRNNGTLAPVLVFVHDGHFQNGHGAYQPPERLVNQGIIIVTFNYRLGVLGFLCLGIPEASGNTGLKDQIAALYWVHRNIANFGGDPENITVYGIGSGATSVHLLLLSGLAEGLIHKAILESGSALAPSSIAYEPTALAMTAAFNLGYNGSLDVSDLVQFFQNVAAKTLSKAREILLPCIENYDYDHSLMYWDPIEVLKKGNYQQVPIIMLYSKQDGISMVLENFESFDHIPQHLEELLPSNLYFNDEKTKLKIAQFVKEFYFDDANNGMEQNYIDYFHDILYEYPIIKSAVLYAEQSFFPVFILQLGCKKNTKNLAESTNYEKVIDYVYAKEGLEDNEVVSEILISLISNFMKLGDPTPLTTSLIPIIWQPVEEDAEGRLNIRTVSVLMLDGGVSMTSTMVNQRMNFWDHVYENFYRSQAPMHE